MAATAVHNIDTLCRELETLTADLRRLNVDGAPSEQELRASPLLDQWCFGFFPTPCLIGAVHQHPLLGNRPSIRTSELILVDTNKRWARTWSRFYRLGDQQRDDNDSFDRRARDH